MTDNYTPQVGDRIRRQGWADDQQPVTVTAIGSAHLLATDPDRGGFEDTWPLTGYAWVKVETPEPLPDAWHILWAKDGGFGRPYPSPEEAKMFAQEVSTSYPVAIVHMWSDADGDHAEIERL